MPPDLSAALAQIRQTLPAPDATAASDSRATHSQGASPSQGAPPAPETPETPPRPRENGDSGEREAPPRDGGEAPNDSPADPDAATDAEPVELNSLEAVAEYLGVDRGDLDRVSTRLKVDGQDLEVTLGEALRSYQLQSHLSREDQALKQRRQELDAHYQGRLAGVDQLQGQLSSYLQALEALIKTEAPDEKLKDDDPERYWALRDQQARHAQLLQAARAQQGQASQMAAAQSQADYEAWLARQRDALPERVGAWRAPDGGLNRAAMETDLPKMVEYLKREGLSDPELSAIVDARHFAIIHKAMRFDELDRARALAPKAKAGSPPHASGGKVGAPAAAPAQKGGAGGIRPGVRPAPQSKAREAHRRAQEQHRQLHSRHSAARLIRSGL